MNYASGIRIARYVAEWLCISATTRFKVPVIAFSNMIRDLDYQQDFHKADPNSEIPEFRYDWWGPPYISFTASEDRSYATMDLDPQVKVWAKVG